MGRSGHGGATTRARLETALRHRSSAPWRRGTESAAATRPASARSRAWGSNNHGQLGISGQTVSSNVPVVSTGLGGLTLTGIAAGGRHSLALTQAGNVMAWGQNNAGQLGNNTTGTDSSTAVQVRDWTGTSGTQLSGVNTIAAGFQHSLAIRSGTVWTWGSNSHGQLGDGLTGSSGYPVQVTGVGGTGTLTGVAAVAGGYEHTAAL